MIRNFVGSVFMKGESVVRCKNCILPVERERTRGYLWADAQGLCSFCRAFRKRFGEAKSPSALVAQLDNIVHDARRKAKGEYDVLIPISGGKDSLTVLDYIVTRYPGIRVLAVTIDNGFLNPVALESCSKVTKTLGVDHIVWAPPHMRELAAIFLRKTGHFCCPCEITLMNVMHKLTKEHGIPLVALGSSRSYDGAHPESVNPWTPPFFDKVLEDEKHQDQLREGVATKRLLFTFGARVLLGKVRMVTVPDLLEWDKHANRARLQEKYNIEIGDEHADCLASPLADWLYKRRCGFGQKTASLAAQVRNGIIQRDKALELLAGMDEFGEHFPLEQAKHFLERTGMSVDEVIACSIRSPEPYFGFLFKAVGFARDLMGLSIA